MRTRARGFPVRAVFVMAGILGVAALAAWSVSRLRVHDPGQVGDSDLPGLEPVQAPSEVPLFTEVTSVTDAVSTDGRWFVLDGRSRRVHRLATDGSLVDAFSRRGQGPGELTAPVALSIHFDTVVVLEAAGDRIHRFDLAGSSLGDRRLELEGCPSRTARDVDTSPVGLLLLVDCLSPAGREARVVLESTASGPRTLAVRAPPEGEDRVLDPMAVPVLAARGAGFLFGAGTDGCLGVYDFSGIRVQEVCHRWITRVPVPRSVAERLAALDRRAVERAGRRVSVADDLPPFDRVFVDGERLVYRAFTPREAMRLVVDDGSGSEREVDVPHGRAVFVSDGSVLAAWADLEGTRLAVYPVPRP